MQVWVQSMTSVLVISLLSLAGGLIVLRRQRRERGLLVMVGFAAGALLGDALLHVLPELSEDGLALSTSFLILAGVAIFFVLEKVLHWHHAHVATEHVVHPVAMSNLVGDALHNFVDGAIVAAAFVQDFRLGLATAIAVALHELPQEIGDFAILLHAGVKPRRALMLNLLTALAAIAGAVMALLLSDSLAGAQETLLAITVGGFIYIAASDLIPELHHETRPMASLRHLAAMGGGVGVMALLLLAE